MTNKKLHDIDEIKHYTGGNECQYKCGTPAEFVVVARKRGGGKVTFAGCQDCLNNASIYPIKNEWLDKRDHAEQRRNA